MRYRLTEENADLELTINAGDEESPSYLTWLHHDNDMALTLSTSQQDGAPRILIYDETTQEAVAGAFEMVASGWHKLRQSKAWRTAAEAERRRIIAYSKQRNATEPQ